MATERATCPSASEDLLLLHEVRAPLVADHAKVPGLSVRQPGAVGVKRNIVRVWSHGWATGLLFQTGGLWIGAHWSPQTRRICINLIPCLTWWIMLPGGKTP